MATKETYLPPESFPFFDQYLVTKDEVDERIGHMGIEVVKDYQNKKTVFIGIANGATYFTETLLDFAQALNPNFKPEIGYLKFSSVQPDGTLGQPHLDYDLPQDLDIFGKHVLITDDIRDRGMTLQSCYWHLAAKGPASLEIAALWERDRERPDGLIAPKYTGFILAGKKWIAGLGPNDDRMGGDGYRNYPGVFLNHPIDQDS